MLHFLAQVYFFTEKEGGRSQDVFSGYMPSLSVNGELIMCRILTDKEILSRGIKYKIKIELPYGEVFKEYFYTGLCFTLNEGGWIIGEGKLIEIIEE
ncbi:hypothetical protein [Cytobacillus horneckiae]|uniref:EF-Tu C-terminal domain-related protein n=1 Tax=Cytobacillus horneckiae TaxID=549687 RepID=UPI003D9AB3B4